MDVRIREAVQADAGAMARVHIDMWRTAYAGIVPAEHLAGLSYERREAVWVQILTRDQPAQCNFVAETVGGEIVGFAGGGPEREGDSTYKGELYAIYLLQEHQRRGIGRRLARAVARGLLCVRLRLDAPLGAGGEPHRPAGSTSRWAASRSGGRPSRLVAQTW